MSKTYPASDVRLLAELGVTDVGENRDQDAAAKAAAFAALLRVFVETFTTYQDEWQPAVFALAVLTLLVGAILAVVQTNVKRMMAY